MDAPLAFEELFRPLVLDAESAFHRQADAVARNLLTPEACEDWTRYLLTRLVAAGSQAADGQFQIYKTVRSVFPVGKHAVKHGSDAVYSQFIGSQPRDRLQKLFAEFPGLANLCCVLVKNWHEATGEFLARLKADCHELHVCFPNGNFACPVARLEPGLSDSHNGGRSVVRLNSADGTSLIYKPRSLAPEAHFAMLIEQINTRGTTHPLKSARCWDRGEYGWMEDVVATPCLTMGEVHNFYWRVGALLGLVYLARGVDFHRENMIAAGQYPVLIDLETLWHPHRGSGDDSSAINSVFNTGFLPPRNLRPDSQYKWSALSGALDPDSVTLESASIDNPQEVRRPSGQKMRGSHHLPTFLSISHPAAEFVSDVEAGFREVGTQVFTIQQKQFIRWRDTLIKQPRRFIRRSTAQYSSALEWLTSPQYLSRATAGEELMEQSWTVQSNQPLLPEEIYALRQMDIPYLKQGSDGADAPYAAEHEELTEETYLAQIPVIVGALANQP